MTAQGAPVQLRSRAEALAARLPPLLVAAQRLAQSVEMGEHGRRQSGQGEAFWQFRRAQPGDPSHRIDWRRSARSDRHYVQEKEWQAAHSVQIWVDPSPSLEFTSDAKLPEKRDQAQMIALALASLLLRGGERVGLLGSGHAPGRGQMALSRIADQVLRADAPLKDAFAVPRARQVVFSDFLAPLDATRAFVRAAQDRGQKGVLFQVLDPMEEVFPFHGRVLFQDVGGAIRHDTREAADLRARYLDRLARRKAELSELAKYAGWRFHSYHTQDPASAALLWLWNAIGGPK
ncbi:hypothetical protein ALP8811_02108 [Aliiroseovarius pelagivivens]|uniref:DUF58 domain-containing protein n=1 Tax=Aliiroseovarius pelagivivens TaxID=1639690 RepID=A0A2R8AM20_9RHOB|nr:DUF58 domain-containing protein [Aliiroseovarius pelagivivens]SPF77085.1 hypothetical protein ALP8811_02108 [Aliiroseovarius pelagivivens]